MKGPDPILPSASDRRILCALLPHVATDRVRNALLLQNTAQPGFTPHSPLALTRQTAASVFVTQVCPLAAARGVRAGVTLGQAYALAPDLQACEDDPAATRELLRALAAWALRFSPLVQAWDDALLLDVTGAARLFRGETALARRVLGGLSQKGLHARVAIADTVGAAYALAQAGGDPVHIAKPRTLPASLAPLPLQTLRIDPRTAAQLDRVGVRTAGELLRLPRGDLLTRFGREVVLRIQQALGEVYEPITPEPAEERPHARDEFDPPLREPQLAQSAALRMLESLAAEVARRGRALRRLECVLYLEGREQIELHVALARATRELRHLRELLGRQLETAWAAHATRDRTPHPAAPTQATRLRTARQGARTSCETDLYNGVVALLLVAQETERWTGQQATLFHVEDSTDERNLAKMLDRFTARLGPHAVVRARPVDDHLPEGAFEYVPVSDWPLSAHAAQTHVTRPPPAGCSTDPRAALPTSAGSSGARRRRTSGQLEDEPAPHAEHYVPRPLRLLSRPVEIQEAPGAPRVNLAARPPTRFTCGGCTHTVSRFWGPQRVETGWWRGSDVRRDYYRVETLGGEQLWLFRELEEGRWFLQGVYA